MNMPTFKILFLLFSMWATFIYGGYATIYDARLDTLSGNQNMYFSSQKIGVHNVYSNWSYKSFFLGSYQSGDSGKFLTLSFGSGKYFSLSSQYKLSADLICEPAFDFSSRFFIRLYSSIGIVKRLSSRFSVRVHTGIPLLTINHKPSFILSLSLNYFYGAGIAYRENSSVLKNVKRKFLGVLWFNE